MSRRYVRGLHVGCGALPWHRRCAPTIAHRARATPVVGWRAGVTRFPPLTNIPTMRTCSRRAQSSSGSSGATPASEGLPPFASSGKRISSRASGPNAPRRVVSTQFAPFSLLNYNKRGTHSLPEFYAGAAKAGGAPYPQPRVRVPKHEAVAHFMQKGQFIPCFRRRRRGSN